MLNMCHAWPLLDVLDTGKEPASLSRPDMQALLVGRADRQRASDEQRSLLTSQCFALVSSTVSVLSAIIGPRTEQQHALLSYSLNFHKFKLVVSRGLWVQTGVLEEELHIWACQALTVNKAAWVVYFISDIFLLIWRPRCHLHHRWIPHSSTKYGIVELFVVCARVCIPCTFFDWI